MTTHDEQVARYKVEWVSPDVEARRRERECVLHAIASRKTTIATAQVELAELVNRLEELEHN